MTFIACEVVITRPREKQRFVIEATDEQAAKSQIKALLDTLTRLRDWTVDVKPLTQEKMEVAGGAMSLSAKTGD